MGNANTNPQTNPGSLDGVPVDKSGDKGNPSSRMGRKKKKRISEHIELEDLWKWKNCLVGEIDTVCRVSSIHRRLDVWGLGEIKVKRMGGKTSVIVIEDGELFQFTVGM
ncbi:hypothetical protein V6N13_009441 [Hibiscus sabdariffa]